MLVYKKWVVNFEAHTLASDVGMYFRRFYCRENDSARLFMTTRTLSSQVGTNLLNQENNASIGSEAQAASDVSIEEQNTSARVLIKKFGNLRMRGGKRTKVRNMLYQTFHRVAQTERDVMKLVSGAVENVKPVCSVDRVGIAGTVYDVPGLVSKQRQTSLAVRWILDAASKRRVSHKITLEKCLFSELLDAHRKKGVARKKRETVHKVASNNRTFAHFRWR